MLKNKVFYVYEAPKTNEKAKPTRFWKEPENPEELNIQDFRLAKLNPLLIAKSISKSDQKKNLHAFPPCFPKPQKETPQVTGPWEPAIRKQLRTLAGTSKLGQLFGSNPHSFPEDDSHASLKKQSMLLS